MDLTPDQVYQAIDNLSSAMSGLGRRTHQDSNAPRLLASSPNPMQGGELQGASFAQQREQRGESPEAMSNGEQKGASFAQPSAQSGASFDSQHGQKGASYAQQSGASFAPRSERRGASFAPQSSIVKDDEYYSNLFYKRLPIMVSDSVIMRKVEKTENAIPSTSVRKNITTRRSRGRTAEPRESSDVTMKRPKGRSKDRAYHRESMGSIPLIYQGPEKLRRCKARMSAEMDDRTKTRIQSLMHTTTTQHERPLGEASRVSMVSSLREVSRVSQTPIPAPRGIAFLKRDIPVQAEHPQAHEDITNLLCIRHQYQEDREEALVDGDDVRHDEAQRLYWECNERMHAISRKASGGNLSSAKRTTSTTASSGEKFVDVDDLPQPSPYRPPSNDQHVARGQEPQGPLEMQRIELQHSQRVYTCQPEPVLFRIWLVFLEFSTGMTVWDAMPMSNIYDFACEWLQTEHAFAGDVDDIGLCFHRWDGTDMMLPVRGVVFDIPLNKDDILEVRITEDGRVSLPRPPGRPSSVSSEASDLLSEYHMGRNTETGPSRLLEEDGEKVGSKSYDKIRQTFKCTKFNGNARDWKNWNKNFMRFLSIWDLDYVVDPEFLDVLPLSPSKRRDNKLVYYIIEDAVQGSALASSYIQQAPLNNGFEAYYTLLDGFVFAGPTTASLLLNELTNFRFLKDETPTAMCLRLQEIFQDLKLLPGDAAMVFNDTQQIGYLLGALRHEKAWENVHSTIMSAQIQGTTTFTKACNELRVRCEASRANDVMDRPVGDKKVRGYVAQVKDDSSEQLTPEKVMAYISTMAMKHDHEKDSGGNKAGKGRKMLECLAKDCTEKSPFPLCGTCYHSLVAAKISAIELKNKYGTAKFNPDTKLVVYPDTVPQDRMPSNVRRVKAAANVTKAQ